MDITIMTTEEGKETYSTFFGDAATHLVYDGGHFAYPEADGTWTAVYVAPPEHFVENFPSKEQAMVYLTNNELSPEEIRDGFGPENTTHMRTYVVPVFQECVATVFVKASSADEAKRAVVEDLFAGYERQVYDWSIAFDEVFKTEVDADGVHEVDEADVYGPTFTVKDGQLANN